MLTYIQQLITSRVGVLQVFKTSNMEEHHLPVSSSLEGANPILLLLLHNAYLTHVSNIISCT